MKDSNNSKIPPKTEKEPALFSTKPFLKIEMEIPKKFVAKVGSKLISLRFFRLLRHASGEEITRLASIQLGDNQNNLADKILFSMINHKNKELTQLQQLSDGLFIVPVVQRDDFWYGPDPIVLMFGSMRFDNRKWFGVSYLLNTEFIKDCPVVVVSKLDKKSEQPNTYADIM